MNKQRKIALVVLFAIIISAFSSMNLSALRVGDEIGNVLYTNVRAYIDGHRIPNYNINNNSSVILLTDLQYYGFDLAYDSPTRTITVTYNPNKPVSPVTAFEELIGRPGDIAFRHLYTDIRAVINGREVTSYNIRGSTAILLEDLRDYGTLYWDSANRASRFTTYARVTGISLNRTTATVGYGESFTLTAAITSANATDKTVTWTSSNINIARVTGSGIEGHISGMSSGTAIITATTANGLTASCTVTVQPAAVPAGRITLDRTNATVRVNEWISLRATIAPVYTTDKTVRWTSSNSHIARVDENGYIIGIDAGTAIITATTANGLTANCTVTVQAAGIPATSLTLDRRTASIGVNESLILAATVAPNNATDKAVTWVSSNSNIVKVYNDGYIVGIAAGTATITATTANGLTASCTITVQPIALAATGVTLDRRTASIGVNESFKLTATVTPNNADKTVTWTSSNANAVWVDQQGYVWGLYQGTAVITVTTASGRSASCTVTVTSDVPPTGITLYETEIQLILGEAHTLIATVTPAYATDKTVTWWSENPAVADVDQYGNILAKSAGNTRIFARTSNGIITSCRVTVISTAPR